MLTWTDENVIQPKARQDPNPLPVHHVQHESKANSALCVYGQNTSSDHLLTKRSRRSDCLNQHVQVLSRDTFSLQMPGNGNSFTGPAVDDKCSMINVVNMKIGIKLIYIAGISLGCSMRQ